MPGLRRCRGLDGLAVAELCRPYPPWHSSSLGLCIEQLAQHHNSVLYPQPHCLSIASKAHDRDLVPFWSMSSSSAEGKHATAI